MNQEAEHRWLGYQPVVGHSFIAVCSCGWRSPPQRIAGVAGALLDKHRDEARDAPAQSGTRAERSNAGPDRFPTPSGDSSNGKGP